MELYICNKGLSLREGDSMKTVSRLMVVLFASVLQLGQAGDDSSSAPPPPTEEEVAGFMVTEDDWVGPAPLPPEEREKTPHEKMLDAIATDVSSSKDSSIIMFEHEEWNFAVIIYRKKLQAK